MNRKDALKTLYHYAAKAAHPDAGGTHDAMIAVQAALQALESADPGKTGLTIPTPDDLREQVETWRREAAEQAKADMEKNTDPFDTIFGRESRELRFCRNCGDAYPRPARQDARYCSSACRNAAWRRRHPTKRKYFRPLHPVCSICGSPFEARRKTARYCSSACAQVAYRRRKADAKP